MSTLTVRVRAAFAVIAALMLALGLAITVTPAQASGDDYPHADVECVHYPYNTAGACANYDWGTIRNNTSNASIYSLRGYGYRNCTDWVAWKLESLGISSSLTRGRGNGNQWDDSSTGVTLTSTPEVGDAAVWNSGGGGYGHVAFVEEIRPKSGGGFEARVSEYNQGGTGAYRDDRWVTADTYVDFNGVGTPLGGSNGGALAATVAISVGPSDNVSLYTPLNWSYRVKNVSGVAASIQRFVVAVRGPSGNALDVLCAGGNGVTLQPNQEWTCDAQLSTGYGQTGPFKFWADWLDFNGNWHKGQLSGEMTLTVGNGATLYAVQQVSVGPSNNQPTFSPLYWSYRVRNTSSGYASIQRFVVAVRGPGNNPLDVQCLNGTNVTLAPQQEWTCDAQLPTGYGQAGPFIFWADWLGYDGSWHHGQLGADKTLTLY